MLADPVLSVIVSTNVSVVVVESTVAKGQMLVPLNVRAEVGSKEDERVITVWEGAAALLVKVPSFVSVVATEVEAAGTPVTTHEQAEEIREGSAWH